jgi:hypothetical protein
MDCSLRATSDIQSLTPTQKEVASNLYRQHIKHIERRGRLVNTPASHSGSSGFKYRVSLTIFVIFLSPSRRMPG